MSRANCESGAGDTRMEFMKGRRFNGSYETPAGVQEIEILANDLKVNINKEKLTRNLNINYNFSLKKNSNRSKATAQISPLKPLQNLSLRPALR